MPGEKEKEAGVSRQLTFLDWGLSKKVGFGWALWREQNSRRWEHRYGARATVMQRSLGGSTFGASMKS